MPSQPPANRTTIRSRLAPVCALLLGTSMLWGCQSIKSAIGLEKSVPDESKVTETPPLTIPPDFALRPPRTGGAPAGPAFAGQVPNSAVAQPAAPAAAPVAGAAPANGAYPAGYPAQASAQPGYGAPGYPAQAYPQPAYGAPAYPAQANAAYPYYYSPAYQASGTDAYFQNAVRQNGAVRGAYPNGYGYGQAPAYPNYAYQAPSYPPAYGQPYGAPAYYPQPAYQQPAYPAQAYPAPPAYGAQAYAQPPAPTPSAYVPPQPAPQSNSPLYGSGPLPSPPAQTKQAPTPGAGVDSRTCNKVVIDAWGDYSCN